MSAAAPDISAVRALRQALGDSVYTTPLVRCGGIELALDDGTRVWGKLEFLQRTGTFKARGALANLHALSREQLQKGVTAVSAGNHAIATAFAARALGTTAKVVMTGSANPYRIDVEATRELLAEHRPELVILGKSMVLHPEPVAEVRRLVESQKERPIIMYDMAHVLGLIGAHFQQPFEEGADLVTGSTAGHLHRGDGQSHRVAARRAHPTGPLRPDLLRRPAR